MKELFLVRLLPALCLLLLASVTAHSQGRNGVGFAFDVNQPFSGDYSAGKGYKIMGSIALTNKWVIAPYVGYENLKGNLRYNTSSGPNGSYYDGRIQNVDLLHLGVDGKYYLNNFLFAKAGVLVYAAGGNEDLINIGAGLSGGAGLSLPVYEHLRFEFTAFTDVIYIQPASGHGVTPYAGLRALISIDFGKPLLKP